MSGLARHEVHEDTTNGSKKRCAGQKVIVEAGIWMKMGGGRGLDSYPFKTYGRIDSNAGYSLSPKMCDNMDSCYLSRPADRILHTRQQQKEEEGENQSTCALPDSSPEYSPMWKNILT